MVALSLVKTNENLTEKNFLLFAAKHYDNPFCTDMEEFYADLSIPMHIKKLLTRYSQSGTLKSRLLLNHTISFFNVFETPAACKLLFFKSEEKHFPYIKTLLTYLNRCPSFLLINGKFINIQTIQVDKVFLALLEQSEKELNDN